MEILENGTRGLALSPASIHRGQTAATIFDADIHESAIFAGGYPGLAQNWPAELTPAPDDREAHHMARFLQQRLVGEGWHKNRIDSVVKTQGESSNSIGDVLFSIRNGLLSPEMFNDDSHIRTIDLVTGGLHGRRFRNILSKALVIDPKRIRRVKMFDTYGTEATGTSRAESAPLAVTKELAAIAINSKVMRGVRPGNLEDLAKAEEQFIAIAQRSQRSK